MSQARGKQAVVGQRVGIAREVFQQSLIVRVGFSVTAVGDQRARSGLLQRDAAGVEGDGASERRHSLVTLPLLCFGAGDALFDEAVIGINLCGAQQRWKISFSGAQREMELVEAAPEEQQD